MSVCVVSRKKIDLSSSLLNETGEDCKNIKGEMIVEGVAVFNSEMKILPYVSDYLSKELKRNKISEETAKTYGLNISYFISYLTQQPTFKNDHLDESLLYVQQHVFEEYFAYLKNEVGLTSATIRNRDASLRSLFRKYLCIERGNKEALRLDDPYKDGLLSPNPKSNLVEMCEIDELISLMRCTDCERERAILQFMYDSGLRRTEVTRVTKRHIEDAIASNKNTLIIDDETIIIPSDYKKVFVSGVKGRFRETKPRYTTVSNCTLNRIKRYHSSPLYRKSSRKFGSDNKPAFLNAHGRAFTPSAIGKLLKRLSKRALRKKYIKRAISPHMLRHGFAGSVLRSPDQGKDALERLISVQHCLGHNQLKTTQVYTSLPYDIYGVLVDNHGEILTRSQVMDRVIKQTKSIIKLKAMK